MTMADPEPTRTTSATVPTRRRSLRLLAATIVAVAATVVGPPGAAAAPPPPPCNGFPQISDPAGDGHHPGSDLLAAWFSEANARVQIVMKVTAATLEPEHPEAESPVLALAFLFTSQGKTQFVRAQGKAPGAGPVTYDYGTYTRAGGFANAGTTTGEAVIGSGGTVTIDVPAATGAGPGATLARPFVLTYDGVTSGQPDWVDHAPGGVSPDDPSVGADYVIGSCGAPLQSPGATPGGPSDPAAGASAISAIQLSAPARLKGGGKATVSGKVFPAKGGLVVTLTRKTVTSVTSALVTKPDGSFSITLPVDETTTMRAVAGAIGSQTVTVTVQSVVTMVIRRLKGGGTRITGRARPGLPGKVLLLRTTSARPTASRRVIRGGFSFRFERLPPGRYQLVFIPSRNRAERSTSRAGVVR